jgi:hypothetical protein
MGSGTRGKTINTNSFDISFVAPATETSFVRAH